MNSEFHHRPEICFLIGAPRSGTTWLQRLLQSHSAICGGEESHFFTLFDHPMRAADEMASMESRKVGPLAYVSRQRFDDAFRGLWDDIFSDLYSQVPNPLVHLEKTPFHSLCVPQIKRLFPEAKFIFLTRDSRAVSASLVHAGRSWGKDWAPSDVKTAALEWRRHSKCVTDWMAEHPETALISVQYEEARNELRGVLERLLEFLLPEGVDLDVEGTIARFNASQSVDPEGFTRMRGSDGWKSDLSTWEKVVVWFYTRKTMQELGYDTSPFR